MSLDRQEKKASIECAPNGPYIVENLGSLQNSQGEPIPTKEVIALCRCGASANKPFCDGSHSSINFSDTKLTDGALDKRETYIGNQITVHDNRGICCHASVCADELESVFNADREPWVDPEAASVQAIIDIIKRCPSGALSYSLDGIEHRDQDRPQGITVLKNGPYVVVGGIELTDVEWGEEASKEHYTLCRCGKSKNVPFCDGTHRHVNFQDEHN